MSARIAIITATPQSVAAGSGTFVATDNLRRGLESLGFEVTVVHPGWSRLPRAYALRRWLFNERLDASTFADVRLVIGIDLDGFTIADRVTAPFVAYIHGQLADEARFEPGGTQWSMRLQARWECRAARRAARVVTLSEYAARRVHELYGVDPAKIAVVPPGIDLTAWMARVEAARSVGPSVRRSVRPTVLAVARLYPRKNLMALVDAARELDDRGVSVRVRIVGDGPERRALRKRIRARGVADLVELVGFVPDGDLPAEFARADVFCLPSLQEGFGLVYVQAMAAGLPVVACRATSTPEVVTDGVNGLLVPPGDTPALAGAIETLLRDDALRGRMAAVNRRRAAQYTPERAARQLIDAVQPPAPGLSN